MPLHSDLIRMVEAGLPKTITSSLGNVVSFKSLKHNLTNLTQGRHFHFVFTHPDDEMAVAKPLRLAAKNQRINTSFNILTDGAHGLEDWTNMTYDQYGIQRLTEFYDSLVGFGFDDPITGISLNEHTFYVDLINEDYEKLAGQIDRFKWDLECNIQLHPPDAIFVNDFAGGHFMHDLANFVVCSVAREKGLRVIEYWQPLLFRDNGEVYMGVGRLGGNNQGRKEKLPSFPELGIFEGLLYLSPLDIIKDLVHKNKVYSSQKKTLSRLDGMMKLPKQAIYPFREIDLDKIDHTIKPEEPSLYEHALWRKRELPRIPVFNDYKALIEFYTRTRNV